MKDKFIFKKENYIIAGIGAFIIILGFILLSGGGSNDPTVFNPEIFNKRRLFWAPFMIILGFIIQVIAILYPLKKKKEAK